MSAGSRARTYEERGRHHPPSGEGGEWKGGKGEPQEPSCRALPWSDLRGTETRRPTTPQPRKREPFRKRARIVYKPTEAPAPIGAQSQARSRLIEVPLSVLKPLEGEVLFEPVCMVSRELLWKARGVAQYGGDRKSVV